MRRVTLSLASACLLTLVASHALADEPARDGDPAPRYEVEGSAFAITLPPGWVAIDSPDHAEQDAVLEAVEHDLGSEAAGQLRWRLGYLGIVMLEWPPLFVLPVDAQQTVGCMLHSKPIPPGSALSLDVDQPAGTTLDSEPASIELSAGPAWTVHGTIELFGNLLDTTWFYVLGDDATVDSDEVLAIVCIAREPPDGDDYWLEVAEGVEYLPLAEASPARVEIPGAGFSLALPAGWRGGATSEEVRTSMVGTLSPSLRDLQTWVLYAEEPTEEAWCAVADMTRQVSESDCSWSRDSDACVERLYRLWSGVVGKDISFLDLPAGRTMHIAGPLDDGSIAGDYYFTDGASWLRLYCERATDAARDDSGAIAESFAFVERSATSEPTTRVKVPEGGFALALPPDWGVRTSGLDQAIEGAELFLVAQHIDGACSIWRWDVVIDGSPGWAGLTGFGEYFVDQYRADAQRLEITGVVLPSGQAQRVGDRPAEDVARIAYLLTDGSAYYSVTCAGPAAHEERWLSIVESFEFLPAE